MTKTTSNEGCVAGRKNVVDSIHSYNITHLLVTVKLVNNKTFCYTKKMNNYIVVDYIVNADGKVCEYFILSCNNHGVFYDMPTFLGEMREKSFYGICWVDNYLASESKSSRFWKLEITKDDVVLTPVTDKVQCQLLKKQSVQTYSHHYAICDVSHLQPATLFCFKKGLL